MAMRIILTAALTGAVIAGCGSAATSVPAAAPVKVATVSVQVCKQRYLAWQRGPAQAATRQFVAAQQHLSAVGSGKNLAAISAAAQAEGQAAATLAGYPVPACADPRGYLAAALDEARAAAASARTASGLSALVKALAPLTVLPELESDFTAELQRTTGIQPSS
jgi:hypothetical protein